ncbi:MAG: hypothetical protein KGJ62_06370 [Armatimonadetes bacterium]|nr:hypothetical protein [Armatimonadota bacterium]MDE2206539.1 hypothetical protein [Armatimonadota bacterium]
MKNATPCAVFGALLFVVLPSIARAAPPPPLYSVINVNPVGSSSVLAYDLNDDYQVVGYGFAGANERGFLWMPGVPSFAYDTISGDTKYGAYAINALGQIAGAGYNSTLNNAANATIWDPVGYLSTGYTKAVDLAGTGTFGSAFHGMDQFGEAVGWLSASNTTANSLLWASNAASQGVAAYRPYAVNYSYFASCGYNPTTGQATWAPSLQSPATPTPLTGGTFGGSTFANYSYAWALDEANDVVGDCFNSTTAGYQAFAWNGMTGAPYGPLGNLPNTNTSQADGIDSVTGQVVGQSGYHAFLWQGDITTPSTGTMTDLNSLIENNSGWLLVHAYAINDYGAIVGYGYYQHAEAAFLAIPVVVSSLTMASPSVVGGNTISGTVTLDAPAPFDMNVTVSSYSSKVNFGAGVYSTGVVIYSGNTSADFVANTSTVTSDTPAVLKATFGGWRRYATIHVLP